MTFPAGSQLDPHEILAPFDAGRMEDAKLPITVVVRWVLEGRK